MVDLVMASLRWSLVASAILGIISAGSSLEISTRIDIRTSKFVGNSLIVTCSVSTSSTDDLREHYVYLYCPLLGDDKICYINCSSMLMTPKGRPVHSDVVQSCEKTWTLKNRYEYQYIVNKNNIEMAGWWHCRYKNHRSTNISIPKYLSTSTPKSTTPSLGIIPESSQQMSTISQETFCPMPAVNTSILAGTVSALTISVIVNILLTVLFCASRCEVRRLKKRASSRDNKYPVEVRSLLSKNSNRQLGLNHSMYSHTPSLDSPSNKESFSTYLQDTIHSNSCRSPTFYVHPDGSIISVISPNNSNKFNMDGTNHQSRNNSKDLSAGVQTFISGVQMRPIKSPRMSAQLSYSGNLFQDQSPQHMTFLSGRTCNSHQQLHDSNDESGIGSESLCNYYSQKPRSFLGGGDKVDLIHDCDPDIMLNRSSVDS